MNGSGKIGSTIVDLIRISGRFSETLDTILDLGFFAVQPARGCGHRLRVKILYITNYAGCKFGEDPSLGD